MNEASQQVIRHQFLQQFNIIYQQDNWGTTMTIQGATVRHLKTALRGRVYQDQRKFCRQIEALGFIMNWSTQAQAWVVHDKVTTGNEGKQAYLDPWASK